MRSRAAHAAELVPELRAALAERSAREWEEIFGERVPCAAVRPIEEMFDHPQVLAEDFGYAIDQAGPLQRAIIDHISGNVIPICANRTRKEYLRHFE